MKKAMFEVTANELCMTSKEPKQISCPQCNLVRINGTICHETGCPNSGARYDTESGEWIKQRECFICGYTVDENDSCCNDTVKASNERGAYETTQERLTSEPWA